MAWLRQTLDHLFTEPTERHPMVGAGRSEADRHRRDREIAIEARRGILGF